MIGGFMKKRKKLTEKQRQAKNKQAQERYANDEKFREKQKRRKRKNMTNAEYMKEYYEKNKEVLLKKQAEYSKKPESIIAHRLAHQKYAKSKKGIKKKAEYRENNRENKKKVDHAYYKKNKEKHINQSRAWAKKKGRAYCRELQKRSTKKRTEDLYKLMGGKCVCCGIDDSIYFSIDHVNNDGYLERKNGKAKKKLTISRYLEAPERFQLLCANCNWAKHVNGGKLYKPKKKRKAA